MAKIWFEQIKKGVNKSNEKIIFYSIAKNEN